MDSNGYGSNQDSCREVTRKRVGGEKFVDESDEEQEMTEERGLRQKGGQTGYEWIGRYAAMGDQRQTLWAVDWAPGNPTSPLWQAVPNGLSRNKSGALGMRGRVSFSHQNEETGCTKPN